MNLRKVLETRIAETMVKVGAAPGSPALVTPSARPQFGDYQANGVMAAAKKLGTSPRGLAEKVVEALDLSDLAEKVEIAGPGFINIFLRGDWLAGELSARVNDGRLGVVRPEHPQTVVVDYSSPNLAKEMHVGHLRSTVIGDALARTLEFLGHNVIRQNHVGDWGTQFGMLVEFIEYVHSQKAGIVGEREDDGTVVSINRNFQINDLEFLYREAKKKFDADTDFREKARKRVVLLQSGDSATLDMWRRYRDESLRHCRSVYARLNVGLKDEHVRGESAYNKDLPQVVADLDAAGMLTESQSAQCVFLDEFKGKDGERLPVIVQKSDGGFLYSTTDLAAMRYRAGELKADRVLYVVDARQALHFRQVFAVARKAGFVPEHVSLEHVGFGVMTDEDGQPYKTREGGTVKLMDLLEQGEIAASLAMDQRDDVYAKSRTLATYRAVGIGAVKYADLCQNRASDYVFSWDKMLSLDGNTAPYMQYAYARIRSIFRKGHKGESTNSTSDTRAGDGTIRISEPAERTLALKLAQFPETVETVAAECLPNLLCGYLFDLAGAFMGFYENCPVLKASAETRASRLALCELTARTIRTGLGLLGIETIEQM